MPGVLALRPFQFLKGTIKSARRHATGYIPLAFQFLKGTIKRAALRCSWVRLAYISIPKRYD